jgi:hypothetical protein
MQAAGALGQHPPGSLVTTNIFFTELTSCRHRWWPLSEIPTATPRGPAIDVFNIGGGRCRTYRQNPLGARH